MPDRATISVVVPLYNKAAYVEAALASVQGQRRPPDQVIVVDDGSTDDGPARVERLAGVTLLRQANAGVSAARNAGIAASTGDLIAFLDADDTWRPDHLADLERLALDHPEAGLLCAGYQRFSAAGAGRQFVTRSIPRGGSGVLRSFYAEYARQSFTYTSAIAVRRAVLQKLDGLFPLGERLGEDQDLWFRLAEAAPVAHVAKVAADYRIDVPGNTASQGAVAHPLPCYERLAERLAAGLVPPHERRGARRLLASHHIGVARTRAALGDQAGARALLWTTTAAANPVYWARSIAAVR